MDRVRFDLGDDIKLRDIRAGDVDELYALTLANREHLQPWMPWAADIRRQATQTYVAGALAQAQRNDGLQTVIVRRDAIIGSMGFHRVDWINRSTSLGYWLAESHQGRGIVTAAVRALVDHAFGTWELHRVEISAAPGNARSRAVPVRLGFVEEGVRRDAERHGEGYVDLVLYGMLAPDWRGAPRRSDRRA
jgi:ribosomal-protein-serine acetyltransferase